MLMGIPPARRLEQRDREMIDAWLKRNKPTTENTEMRIERLRRRALRKIKKLNKSELAKMLDCSENYASRVLSGDEPLGKNAITKILGEVA